jgi:23S rRNA (guanosine2251-2'-O)-methyltransferase
MPPNNKQIILIAHNIRACENVGSILRTADTMAINKVYFTGLTPYPRQEDDSRLPHIIRSNHNKIAKSALGAETTQNNQHHNDINELIKTLKLDDYILFALEQHKYSKPLTKLKSSDKIAIIIGNEVQGLDAKSMKLCDFIIEIPMLGQKESLNVAQAAAITMFYARYF